MRRLLPLLLVTATSGCSWLVGYDVLPQLPSPVRLRATAADKLPGLAVDVTALGIGDRVPTEKNMWGRTARAVNPYGEDTLVFRASLVNAGDRPAFLTPSRATLSADGEAPRPARTLDDYRRRWPTWAVDGHDQEADRAAAIGYVLDTMLVDRMLSPDGRVEGRLAFALPHVTRKLDLVLPVRTADTSKDLHFVWEVF